MEENQGEKVNIKEDISIKDMGFSARAFNCLNKSNIRTLNSFKGKTIEELLKIRNLGRNTLNEIIRKMEEYGFHIEKDKNGKERFVSSQEQDPRLGQVEEECRINEFGEIIRPTKTDSVRKKKKKQENDTDRNLDNLSDEELDEFIEDMNAKQKEKQQKIERLRKIKRAKDLIALSKDQDREISDLERQIYERGIEVDE